MTTALSLTLSEADWQARVSCETNLTRGGRSWPLLDVADVRVAFENPKRKSKKLNQDEDEWGRTDVPQASPAANYPPPQPSLLPPYVTRTVTTLTYDDYGRVVREVVVATVGVTNADDVRRLEEE
jgi:hypothetical protein